MSKEVGAGGRFDIFLDSDHSSISQMEEISKGQNLPVQLLWSAEALFSYTNLRVKNSVREANPFKNFHLRGIAPVPLFQYVPGNCVL